MIIKKQYWIGLIAAVGVSVGAAWFMQGVRDETPYQEGSGEWVGYTAAEASGFMRVEDCASDPETKDDVKYVKGCKAWINKR